MGEKYTLANFDENNENMQIFADISIPHETSHLATITEFHNFLTSLSVQLDENVKNRAFQKVKLKPQEHVYNGTILDL